MDETVLRDWIEKGSVSADPEATDQCGKMAGTDGGAGWSATRRRLLASCASLARPLLLTQMSVSILRVICAQTDNRRTCISPIHVINRVLKKSAIAAP
jgi:hypothetical protein